MEYLEIFETEMIKKENEVEGHKKKYADLFDTASKTHDEIMELKLTSLLSLKRIDFLEARTNYLLAKIQVALDINKSLTECVNKK